MNIILLEEYELGHNLSRRDDRTIHLLKVLHKKTGDSFEAGILGGMKGTGRIEKINLDGSIFVSLNVSEPPPPRARIRMAAGFVRPIQIRRLLRDLSSMGVSAIDLVGTDLGEKSYRDTKLLADGGAREALIEGAIQARDTCVPALSVYDNLETWLKERPWESGWRTPLLAALDNADPEGSVSHLRATDRPAVLAVGPERGWSDRERALFKQAGFLRLSMGNRALRTETACVVATALMMDKVGEFT
ncbi:MAG: 16S rRNA (uracil(1498)-N(3))-methyltransferase [Treponema sp.]|jgi:RsmE family RNA methyltransferase|nr:16S rRNA (uracil(1498)-N(3))-methyltransferase [Treponema sp.]